MTLRTRTLLIVSLTLVGLLGVLFMVARISLHRGFADVEKDLSARFATVERNDARKNVQRAIDALNANIGNLAVKVADWAQWDDTYRYVEDVNARYAKSNLTEQALSSLKLNYMAIVNISGRIVFSFAYDPVQAKKIPLPEGIADHVKKGALLLNHTDPQGLTAGIALLKQGPMMFASRPIVTSDLKGPIRGAVVFGQFLNDTAVKNLALLTHLDIEVKLPSDSTLPAPYRQAQSRLAATDSPYVDCANVDSIFGYALIKDIYHKPALLTRISIPREIHKQGLLTLSEVRAQGRKTLLTLMIGVTTAGVALGAVILLILELSVLSRLKRLSVHAGRIAESKDFTARVGVEGNDELTTVGVSMNRMLNSLSQTHHELQQRTDEMHLLMNTVPVGLLSLNEQLRVNPEYSRSAEEILDRKELAGVEFTDLLGLSKTKPRAKDCEMLEEFLELFRKETLPEKDMAPLNPFETLRMSSQSGTKWIQLGYHLIRNVSKENHHILVVIEDISAAKEMQQQIVRSQQENLQLKAIVEEPELFIEFMAEARGILESAQSSAADLTPGQDCRPLIGEIFRNVHTIKGIAGAFALSRVIQRAGELEDTLTVLRTKETLSGEKINSLRKDVSVLMGAIEEVSNYTKTFLGADGGNDARASLHISLAELKRLIAEIKAMSVEKYSKDRMILDAKENILHRLTSMKMVPAVKGLARALKVAPDLIRRLGKDAVVTFEGKDTPIDCEVARELTTPLVHLLRNAIDHGIESPGERALVKKPPRGEIKLSVRFDHGELVLEIADDGKGMDPQRLKEAAISKKMLGPREAQTLSPAQCFELILRSGFSTKTEVTEVSGRGVGLDAVVHSVKNKLNGAIHIESRPGKGSTFTLRVPAAFEDDA